MKSTSRTGSTQRAQKREVVRATSAQIVRQVGLILLVLAIWAGLLVVYLNLTGKDEAPVSESPQPTEVVSVPQPTNPAPTEQPVTATAIHTILAPTDTPAATSSPAALPTEPPEAASGLTDTPPPPAAGGVSFSADVLPILTNRCQRCHSGGEIEAGLNLLSYAGVMAGSEHGPIVVPGNSASSVLVQVIVSGDMPKRAPKLPTSEIETIGNWVDEGALDN